MHPNPFLKTFWRLDLEPRVFVAMSFAERYQRRFKDVIEPAIQSIEVDGVRLDPLRVDLSHSGDSILTMINEGIAHSRLVLADISTVGHDSVTSEPYRNGNVMYEVGIALACRLPHEVLLVRDDREKFLFDVSTIPYMTINFTDTSQAISELREGLRGRLDEANHFADARVEMAVAGLSGAELEVLKMLARGQENWSPEHHTFGTPDNRHIGGVVPIPRLLDKRIIRLVGEDDSGRASYQFTSLGRVVIEKVRRGLPATFPITPPGTSTGTPAT